MTTQAIINFDAAEAERQRDAGIDQAETNNQTLLETARRIALRYAETHATVTMDDVFAEMLDLGLHPELLGNASGAVFRSGFEFTGDWRKSKRVSSHARMIRVWRLK